MQIIDKVKILKKMADSTYQCAKTFQDANERMYATLMAEHMTYEHVIAMLIDDDDAKEMAKIYHVEID